MPSSSIVPPVLPVVAVDVALMINSPQLWKREDV